jgi:hypothetical protein
MKKLMVIALLALAGCTKKHDCMHMHLGGAQLEVCSANVVCLESKDETGTSKLCQYVPSEKPEGK